MFSSSLQIVGTEWLWIIFLIVFLLFGSKKLPEVSRNLGKAMREIQKGRAEIEREFRTATALPDVPPKKPNQIYKAPDIPTYKPPEKDKESKDKQKEDTGKDMTDIAGTKPEKKVSLKNKQKGKASTEPKKKE